MPTQPLRPAATGDKPTLHAQELFLLRAGGEDFPVHKYNESIAIYGHRLVLLSWLAALTNSKFLILVLPSRIVWCVSASLSCAALFLESVPTLSLLRLQQLHQLTTDADAIIIDFW